MNWEIFNGTESEWQKKFFEYDGHYRQSYQWGNYKSRMGWKVIRLSKKSDDKNLNLVQITYKKFKFFCAAYIPGEILGNSINLDEEFRKKILEHTKSKILYIRIDSTKKNIINEQQNLKSNSWSRPFIQKQVPKVSICNLSKNFEDIIKFSSDGWKKNYNYTKTYFFISKITLNK